MEIRCPCCIVYQLANGGMVSLFVLQFAKKWQMFRNMLNSQKSFFLWMNVILRFPLFSSTRTRGILKFQFFVVSQKRDYFYDDCLSDCETTFVKENFCRCCSIEEVGKSCHMKKCYWTKWHPFLFYQTKRYFITLIFWQMFFLFISFSYNPQNNWPSR